MIKKTTEIDAILLNLNKAIDAHYQWLVSMFHSVVARDASKPEITDNHSYGLCQFGRWIDHLGPLDNDELPYVRLMDSAHQHMHNCGRELMLAIVENHWQDAHFDAFQEGLLSFTAALTDYKIYLLTIRSNMDVLTGLPGRRVLDESFDHQLRNAEPLNLYLMLLDIDRFKLVNDTYGHLIGDVVLRTLATYLASWTRDYETVYRYGGEEFIIIVKAANDEEACRAGIRICQLVDNHAIAHSEGHINITVTAGVSRAFPEEPLDVVIGRADRAMYEGKQTGRNRCMFIDEQNVINRV
ncbi:TPA: diguanylate cyclase DgcZ [Escherichia coli]|uniref:diguanylate cyclase n=1 Tax=Escherichia coli TaxID=562 RepID=A0AAW7VIK7_ECOLX|nr:MULTISPECIES: diguanylate cyclase DgcZ [Escherichia]EGO6544509.1 diguanylate cyclase DgcZ [Escherichia coli]EHL1440788.1 diguanylate cyclase DgcZ [Escherichia coli]EKO8722386.1 diguanylate cyclase DgcZ [Escherichia coli]ELT0185625.1 diguanylate cyclase DgcZ [Escherichia coli]EMD6622676.1 diguanylate cyclase DgcZ [Escherichia coli]